MILVSYFFVFLARGFLVFGFFSFSAMIFTFIFILLLTIDFWSKIFCFRSIFKFYDTRWV